MPWSNNNGGGGGGGGPWQPRNNSPWGQGSGGGGGGNRPPNIEDMLRKGQDRLRRVVPGGGGSIGGLGIVAIGLIAALVWLGTGIYTVRPNEVGIERVFGKFYSVASPGLNYNWPYPIGRVDKPTIAVQSVEIGMRSETRSGSRRNVPQESLMLTGDENIVDIDFTVLWRIDEQKPQDFVFNLRNNEQTVKAVAEAAMREIIGKSNVLDVLTGARQKIEQQVHDLMQKTLNEYGAGVVVQQVQMQKVDPPQQVINAFRDVQAARADQERAQNEAQAYANKAVPEARGETARIIQRAEAEKEKMVANAKGEAAQFIKLYDEYRKAPDVTRQRLFLESIERIYGGMDKIILDNNANGGQGVVPYLPLNELNRRSGQQGAR
jgi:membrane protease subunit HflK